MFPPFPPLGGPLETKGPGGFKGGPLEIKGPGGLIGAGARLPLALLGRQSAMTGVLSVVILAPERSFST